MLKAGNACWVKKCARGLERRQAANRPCGEEFVVDDGAHLTGFWVFAPTSGNAGRNIKLSRHLRMNFVCRYILFGRIDVHPLAGEARFPRWHHNENRLQIIFALWRPPSLPSVRKNHQTSTEATYATVMWNVSGSIERSGSKSRLWTRFTAFAETSTLQQKRPHAQSHGLCHRLRTFAHQCLLFSEGFRAKYMTKDIVIGRRDIGGTQNKQTYTIISHILLSERTPGTNTVSFVDWFVSNINIYNVIMCN